MGRWRVPVVTGSKLTLRLQVQDGCRTGDVIDVSRGQIHYELYVRQKPSSGWALGMATEDRAAALAAANGLIAEGKVVGVRVTKETLDPETREFASVDILKLGQTEPVKAKKVRENNEPLCVTPQDLYSVHARERIARLLDQWLDRNKATPFELLHRPDLVEQLDASGTDLQHAIQKVAIPEAQARGLTVHELIRTFQGLVERTIDRILKDARKGNLPDLTKEGFAKAAIRVSHEPDRAYLLGAGVAGAIAPAKTWSDKISRILDLADTAPETGPPRGLALQTLEQPLAEILGSRAGLDDFLGAELDLGARLAAMTRLAASRPVEALIAAEPSVARIMPCLPKTAERLASWLITEDFSSVRAAIGKRIVRELNGPRRLCPTDPLAEIASLRGLAMALTAASGSLMPLEDVQEAFTNRSRMLVTTDFVEAYLADKQTARDEAESLVWLIENVIGAANKRQASRYLASAVNSLRFETELQHGFESPTLRLQALANLQKTLARAGLVPEDILPIQTRIGAIGGLIEADTKLIATLARQAQVPALQRLMLLLRLAVGDAGPTGPVADRARLEALKLMRMDEVRAELGRSPERMTAVSQMIQQLGKLAA